jgi:hypothetical protein
VLDEAAVLVQTIEELAHGAELAALADGEPVKTTVEGIIKIASTAKAALAEAKNHLATRAAIKKLYGMGAAQGLPDAKLKQCQMASGSHRGGLNWNIEHKGMPESLEMLDELHAGLRSGAGFIDKMSALAYALDKLDGARTSPIRALFIREVTRRANVEFKPPAYSSGSKQLVSKQVYGNDFEAFLAGTLTRGTKASSRPAPWWPSRGRSRTTGR